MTPVSRRGELGPKMAQKARISVALMSGRAQGVTDVRWKSGDVPRPRGGLAVIMFRITRPRLNLRVTTEVQGECPPDEPTARVGPWDFIVKQ